MLNARTQTPTSNDIFRRECFQRNFHGAAIIDSQGHEIPMTAEMIDSVLDQLSHEMESKPKKYGFITF